MHKIRISSKNLKSRLVMAKVVEASTPLHLRQMGQIILYRQKTHQTPDIQVSWTQTQFDVILTKKQNWLASRVIGTPSVIAPWRSRSQPIAFPHAEPSEWLLFFQSLCPIQLTGARTKNHSEYVLSDKFYRPALCNTWNQIQHTSYSPPQNTKYVDRSRSTRFQLCTIAYTGCQHTPNARVVPPQSCEKHN